MNYHMQVKASGKKLRFPFTNKLPDGFKLKSDCFQFTF